MITDGGLSTNGHGSGEFSIDDEKPVAPPVQIAPPVPVAPPVPIATPVPIGEGPRTQESSNRSQARKIEFRDRVERVKNCGVRRPNNDEIEAYYEALAEKRIEDVDLAREIAQAVAGLREASRKYLQESEETWESSEAVPTVQGVGPEFQKSTREMKAAIDLMYEKSGLEISANIISGNAAMVEYDARGREEMMERLAQIIQEKREKGEDPRREIRQFASEARNARLAGVYENFKFEVRRALGRY
jgi:hypothetical protein